MRTNIVYGKAWDASSPCEKDEKRGGGGEERREEKTRVRTGVEKRVPEGEEQSRGFKPLERGGNRGV